jgi:alpha-galactosidase
MLRNSIFVFSLTLSLAAAATGGEASARFRPGSAVYRSGTMTYREQLRDGRLVALPLDSAKAAGTAVAAFELRIRTSPSEPELDLATGWRWVRAQSLSERHHAVDLAHQTAPIALRVHTLLDGTSVIQRWLEIRNTGRAPLAITALAPWCGQLWRPADNISAGYTTREHYPWEGWFEWRPLAAPRDEIRQEIGLAYRHPIFVLRNDSTGEFLFAQLGWPANRRFDFDRGARVSFRASITSKNALRVIAAGETVETPALHLGFTRGDFDLAVQNMHEHVRRSVLPAYPPERAYRIQCLLPEDQSTTIFRGKEYNERNLLPYLDVVAAAGVELFLLDGPFWLANYGEWLKPHPELFPRGLTPLVQRAHELKMLFGLYAEPEGGRNGFRSPGSTATIGGWNRTQVYREHPDWFVPGKSAYPAPVLNLAITGAASYFANELERMVSHYGLDLYRHDFCMPEQGEGSATERDGFLESDYWRHYDALYAGFDRLRARHPNLLLQQASGGGTRLDLASLAHWHEHFTSDRTSTPHVYRMLSGLTVYLPPEVLVTPMGMADAKHRPGLRTLLRSTYALANTPMPFNSLFPRTLGEFQGETREMFAHYSTLYKQFMRPALNHVKTYHHAPVNAAGGVTTGDWFAMELASEDRARAWALIVRLAPRPAQPFVFKAKSLDPRRAYRMTRDNTGKTETVKNGATVSIGIDQESELLLFERR